MVVDSIHSQARVKQPCFHLRVPSHMSITRALHNNASRGTSVASDPPTEFIRIRLVLAYLLRRWEPGLEWQWLFLLLPQLQLLCLKLIQQVPRDA